MPFAVASSPPAVSAEAFVTSAVGQSGSAVVAQIELQLALVHQKAPSTKV